MTARSSSGRSRPAPDPVHRFRGAAPGAPTVFAVHPGALPVSVYGTLAQALPDGHGLTVLDLGGLAEYGLPALTGGQVRTTVGDLAQRLLWGQVRHAPGAVGASLIAQPLKRTFWTLSAWESRDDLYVYAGTEPHRTIMTGLRSVMSGSTFVFWEVPVEGLPISWGEARRRLAEKAAEERRTGNH